MTDYNLVEEYFLKVDKFFAEGEFAQAKELLEEILTIEPDYGRAHNHLGWVYFVKFDDYTRAEYHFKLAMKYAPDYPAAWMNYVYLLNEINDADKLVKLIPKAMKVEGINKASLFNELARSCELNGFLDEAVKNYGFAYKHCMGKDDIGTIEENLKRVNRKISFAGKMKRKRFVLF